MQIYNRYDNGGVNMLHRMKIEFRRKLGYKNNAMYLTVMCNLFSWKMMKFHVKIFIIIRRRMKGKNQFSATLGEAFLKNTKKNSKRTQKWAFWAKKTLSYQAKDSFRNFNIRNYRNKLIFHATSSFRHLLQEKVLLFQPHAFNLNCQCKIKLSFK